MSEPFDLSSRYYDLLYRDKDYASETDYIVNLLTQHGKFQDITSRSPAILELGCGTGVHAESLARLGYEILGVDQNPGMLDRSKQRFESSGLSGLECQLGDVRSFRAGRAFDTVLSLFHVASYQTTDDDISQLFETAATHLTPGGLFIFDVWYGPAVLAQLPSVRIKRVDDHTVDIFRVAEPVLHAQTNCVDVNYHIFITERDTGTIHRLNETHKMRYYFEPEIKRFAANAGMEVVHQEEWMSGHAPSVDSWGVVFIVKKLKPEN